MTELSPDYFTKSVADVDPEIAEVLRDEANRQETTLEMIASENFVPQAILETRGSVLTNKYAEGYPGKRYYGGCEFVDVAEQLAIDRAKEVFGAEHVNVQPHSGALATSGDYERFVEVGGVRHCHILDPRTGRSARGFQSVSVLAPTCLVAGSATTIAMIKGRDAGLAWLRSLGLAYLAVLEDGSVVSSLAAA